MSRRGVLVLGSLNTDLVVRSPRLPRPGETVLGGHFYEAAGGKGANQAVAAARAASKDGPTVVFVGAVGNDAFGLAALDRLDREGIDCRFVKTVAGQASGVALILVDQQGENMISVASGANAELLPEDVDVLPESLFHEAAVFLASLELPLATVIRGLERAKAAGALTILNPAPAIDGTATRDVMRLVDLLTPNEGEAAALAGRPAATIADTLAAARDLQQLGCGRIIVTLGARGCLAVEREVPTEIGARPVIAVDATAAGDAFNGALAVALCEGKPLLEAAHWANRAAAISVTRTGAQPSLPQRAEIETFLG